MRNETEIALRQNISQLEGKLRDHTRTAKVAEEEVAKAKEAKLIEPLHLMIAELKEKLAESEKVNELLKALAPAVASPT